jgi:hypothetical protein
MAEPKVPVKNGQTLTQFAKANNTTVAAIIADPRNATIAARVAAGTTPVFNGTTIAVPVASAKTTAPTSGVVPNFTPTITPAPNTSGMFVGPIPVGTTRTTSGYVPTVVKDPNAKDPNNPVPKKETGRVKNADGTFTVSYDDGTTEVVGDPTKDTGLTKYTADDGTVFTDQNAFANYQGMLRANAKSDYNAAQAAAAKTAQDQADKRDAFALISDTMKSFGFTDAEVAQLGVFAETQIMDANIGPNQGILNMKALPVYKARFSGNQTLLAAGKNALSEADYLAQENAYGEYMKAYGVDKLGTRDQYATLIGNSISATELNKRLNLAVDRVKNSDPEILKQLKTYYPTITDSDLVTYFLKPTEFLPELEKKVATSEISAAAVGQGFGADMTGAADLQAFGITREKALTGYQDIKTVLPLSEKLSAIYGEAGIKYDRAAGESEFFKNSADASEKRRQLKSMERASFTGATSANLSRTQQGQF